jgi:CBS domain-containing membrane protein
LGISGPVARFAFSFIGIDRAGVRGRRGTQLEKVIVMRVQDLMQRDVVTLEASDHLDLADDIMRLGRIRHMPVLAGDRLVGILSQRDLFRAGISSVLRFRADVEREWLGKISLREVMTTHVFTIAPEAPIADAVAVMLAKRIGCLPVVADERLVGVLSESDCLRYLARLLEIAEVKDTLPEMPEAQ